MSRTTLFKKKLVLNFYFMLASVFFFDKKKRNQDLTRVVYSDIFSNLTLRGTIRQRWGIHSYVARFHMNTYIAKEQLVLSFPLSNPLVSLY